MSTQTTSNPNAVRPVGESLSVIFRSLGRSRREWAVRFELGAGNSMAAMTYALRHNAEIVSTP